MCKKKFSVLLLIYNSELRAILLTLKSIIKQKCSDIELIIADDGSQEKYTEEIEEYLKKNNFHDYKFAPSDQNVGTVANILRAMAYADGEYVKCIGAGDLLADETVLGYVYENMQQTNAKWCFGEMVGYCIKQGQVESKVFVAPLEKRPYKKDNMEAAKKRIVLYRDYISGAAMFFKREYLEKYLLKIKGIVKYAEDIIQILIMLEDKEVLYLPRKLILYEVGTGISTKTKKNEKMEKDFLQLEKYLMKNYKDDLIYKREKRIDVIENGGFLYKHLFLLLTEPKQIFLEKKRKYLSFSIRSWLGFLDDRSFLEEFMN